MQVSTFTKKKAYDHLNRCKKGFDKIQCLVRVKTNRDLEVVLKTEPKVSQMLSKKSTTEVPLSPKEILLSTK